RVLKRMLDEHFITVEEYLNAKEEEIKLIEIDDFASSIINDTPLENGTSRDAFKTMKLITQIYYADPVWRAEYDIQDPTGIHV
mgnify:CR=1